MRAASSVANARHAVNQPVWQEHEVMPRCPLTPREISRDDGSLDEAFPRVLAPKSRTSSNFLRRKVGAAFMRVSRSAPTKCAYHRLCNGD